VLELGTARSGVDRHEDRPEPRARQERVQRLEAVLGHHADPVARADPGARERAREGRSSIPHRGEGPHLVAVDDEGRVREQRCLALEERGDHALGRCDVRPRLRTVAHPPHPTQI
jgi:hypothetical protein